MNADRFNVPSNVIRVLAMIWDCSHKKVKKRITKVQRDKFERSRKEFFDLARQYPELH